MLNGAAFPRFGTQVYNLMNTEEREIFLTIKPKKYRFHKAMIM